MLAIADGRQLVFDDLLTLPVVKAVQSKKIYQVLCVGVCLCLYINLCVGVCLCLYINLCGCMCFLSIVFLLFVVHFNIVAGFSMVDLFGLTVV